MTSGTNTIEAFGVTQEQSQAIQLCNEPCPSANRPAVQLQTQPEAIYALIATDCGLLPQSTTRTASTALSAGANLTAGRAAGRSSSTPSATVTNAILPYAELIESREFLALDQESQAKFLALRDEALAQATSSQEKTQVEQALQAFLRHKLGYEPSLMCKDKDGNTLLDNLHSLYTASLEPGLQGRRVDILCNLADEITNPNKNINQGAIYATCVATAAALKMAREFQPAEYARLICQLATQGSASLHHGHHIVLSSHSLQDSAMIGRSLTESMLQTALGNMVGAYHDGVYTGQFEQMCEALFGVAFERLDNSDTARLISEAGSALQRGSQGVCIASVRTDIDGKHANHALLIESIDNGYVYFRNPWGAEYSHPEAVGAKEVSGQEQLFRMSLQEFKARVNFVMANSATAQLGITEGAEQPGVNILTELYGVEFLLTLGSSRQSQFSSNEEKIKAAMVNRTA